jgi:hypothetical protein
MKKIWKIVLISSLVLIIGVGGVAYYYLNMKTYDIADKKVDEIVDSKYDVELPEAEEAQKDPGASKTPDTPVVKPEPNTDTNNNGSTSNPEESDNVKEVTAESIIEKYRPTFESLQAQANIKIDSLVSTAITEYKENLANGESNPFAYYYRKYNLAAKRLEAQTDETFNYIYSAMQDDLEKHGFDPDEAKSIKDDYETTKNERETALINKAKEALLK